MRIFGKKICRTGIEIGEVATATAGDADFFGEPGCMVDQHDRTAALAGSCGAHHAGGTCADDGDIEFGCH